MSRQHPRKTRLLTINFGGIGDEILFLPALASIRNQFPDWHITLLVEPRSQSISRVTDLIDATVTFDIKKRPLRSGDLIDLLGLLRDGSYDLVLSSGSSPAVAVLLFLSGIPVRVGYDSGELSRLLLTAAVPLNRGQYAGAMLHDLVSGLGIRTPAPIPEVVLDPSSVVRAGELLAELEGATGDSAVEPRRRILIHPGTSRLAVAKGILKTWSTDNWTDFVKLLAGNGRLQPILSGGPDDREAVAEIETGCANTGLLSTAGRTRSLGDLAALISMCDLLVCVDSAPMHLAVALGKPLVALFGPTDEARLLPPDPRFRALRGEPLSTYSALPRGFAPAAAGRQDRPARQGVQIPPDCVYRAVMDQLSAASDLKSSPE